MRAQLFPPLGHQAPFALLVAAYQRPFQNQPETRGMFLSIFVFSASVSLTGCSINPTLARHIFLRSSGPHFHLAAFNCGIGACGCS